VTRLSRATLTGTSGSVAAPRGRSDGPIGVVHFGPGAFHRAHQADYFDRLLDHDPRWGIAAVSLRTRGTIEALAAQDGFYTLAIRDAEASYRVIGAHRRFLGPEDGAETLALLADPTVRLVTSTVTEKGYCLAADGTLDLAHPDIVHDLAAPSAPVSLIGWLVAGLQARRAAGIVLFVPMPCDNLAANGAKLKAALVAFAAARDASLGRWITDEVVVPSTMVDSITPAADDRLVDDVRATLGGLEDGAPVQREAFTQWVIEDIGDRLGPDLASVGATITRDVAGYERAKLRILNGAHSTLAYVGLLRGHTSVAQAMADGPLARFVDTMVRADIAPTLPPVAGLDLDAYTASVMARFRNPAILHRLDQIAQDGSQKLPYRLGDTLAANRASGRLPRHLLAALGCWVAFLVARTRAGVPIIDPAAETLTRLAQTSDASAIVDALAQQGLGLTTAVQQDHAATSAIAEAADHALGERWDAFGLA
jgi:fructuronate reductase